MDKLSGKELANAFGDAVNNHSFDGVEFIEHFKRQHRTLQQSMVKTMLQCIEAVADSDYRYDGRNESSHNTCKVLVSGWRKEMISKLIVEDSNYWTEEKAITYVNNPNVKLSNLPHI